MVVLFFCNCFVNFSKFLGNDPWQLCDQVLFNTCGARLFYDMQQPAVDFIKKDTCAIKTTVCPYDEQKLSHQSHMWSVQPTNKKMDKTLLTTGLLWIFCGPNIWRYFYLFRFQLFQSNLPLFIWSRNSLELVVPLPNKSAKDNRMLRKSQRLQSLLRKPTAVSK